jgi:hypothetical protein
MTLNQGYNRHWFVGARLVRWRKIVVGTLRYHTARSCTKNTEETAWE